MKQSSMPKIKVCGLTGQEEAGMLARNRIVYAGMVLFYPKSKRNITAKRAAEILMVLPEEIHPVAVTVSPTPEQAEELARQGFLMLDQGYVRPLKLTPAFLADLDAHDLFQLYRSGEERVCMIHGDEDQTASPEAARRFAQTFGARLIQVPGGDHSLSGPGMPQLVVREALEFYLAP